MAYSSIVKPEDYFNTKLYTGTGSAQSITGVGFKPDLVWGKNRSTTNWHDLEDVVRGATKRLSSNESDAEATETNNFTSFDSDGFSVGSGANVNGNGNNIVVWNWKANGTGSANTDGSISSTVSANTTSGFSIVSYTGSSANSNIGTVGHGLNTTPNVLILKDRDATSDWQVFHSSLPTNKYLDLNTTDAAAVDTNVWNNTAPTSSVFTVGNNSYTNANGRKFIAYCFAEKQGYSKFSKYVCNQNADGPFIYTGFKPAFVMIKRLGTDPWMMLDNRRDGYNVTEKYLTANASGAEATEGSSVGIDLLSNGFKCRGTSGKLNSTNSGVEYIYMAFAEQPLVGDNPATAR